MSNLTRFSCFFVLGEREYKTSAIYSCVQLDLSFLLTNLRFPASLSYTHAIACPHSLDSFQTSCGMLIHLIIERSYDFHMQVFLHLLRVVLEAKET